MIKFSEDNGWNGKGIAIGHSNMEAHKGHPLKLSYTVIFICRKGTALVQVNFKNYLLKPNDVLVLSHDSIGIFKRTSPDFSMFYGMIDKELATEVAYDLPNHLFSYLWEMPHCIPTEIEIPLLQGWIEQAQHLMQYCKTYQYTMLRNHLQNFFLKIAENIPHSMPIIAKKHSRKEVLCWKFWDMVGKYCKEHREVSFYADKLCITPFYLSQITGNFFKDSPKELINRQVILEIKSLLKSTELSIKEIADHLHFDDPSYMCRYFKRQTGVSTSAYRK